MSLRSRLFLVVGGVVALLVLAQWWWAWLLAGELSDEFDQVAMVVGSSVASLLAEEGHLVPGDSKTESRLSGSEGILEEAVTEPQSTGPKSGGDSSLESAAEPTIVRIIQCVDGDCHEEEVTLANVGSSVDWQNVNWQHSVPQRQRLSAEAEHAALAAQEVFSNGLLGAGEVSMRLEYEGQTRYLKMVGPMGQHRFNIPRQGLNKKIDRFSQRLFFGSVVFLTLGLLLSGLVAQRVSAPLRELASAARQVGEGKLGVRVSAQTGGEVALAIAAFNSMSERLQKLETETQAMRTHQHLGEIGEIARGMAHTLRNPLNALGLSVEELALQAPGQTEELVESARRQIRRMDHSIRSFLALASQGGGVVEEVDVAELVQDVALGVLQDNGGKVRFEMDAEMSVGSDSLRLRAVEPELRAVVQALVVNAFEASPPGGRVKVGWRRLNQQGIRLEIEDQGAGLQPEIRRELFTPHLSTKADGSGMGLFLAQRIATSRYGGTIDLVDLQPRGLKAILELQHRRPVAGEGQNDG